VSSHTAADREQILDELLDIGLAVASERDLYALLDQILEAARRFTRAEAGTLFLREGDRLRFAVVQNDLVERSWPRPELQQRFEAEPCASVSRVSPATWRRPARWSTSPTRTRSACTRPAPFNARFERHQRLRHALGARGPPSRFDRQHRRGARAPERLGTTPARPSPSTGITKKLIRALAAHAAVAIRNARLEEHLVQGQPDRALPTAVFRPADRRGGQAPHPVRASRSRSWS